MKNLQNKLMNIRAAVKHNGLSWLCIVLFTSIIWAQPMPGGARIPSLILMLFGIILIIRNSFDLMDIRWRQLFLIFALFWVPALVSVWGSYDLGNSAKFIFLMPLFLLFGITLFFIMDNYLAQDRLFHIITAICCFWLADASIQFYYGSDIFGIQQYGGRIVGPFKEHLRLGLFLSVLLPITLRYLARYTWICQVGYLLVTVVIVMLTGVRTDLLTVILAASLYILSSKQYRLVFAVLAAIILALTFAGTQSEISRTKINSFSHILSENTDWNRLSSYRLDIWSVGWNMFIDNPVKGVGVRNFAEAYDDYSSKDNFFHGREVYHAHHPIVSIATETGLIGVLGLFTAIFLLYSWGKQSLVAKESLFSNPWGQILILIIFPLQSMPLLFSLWWFPFITFTLVCYLSSIYSKEEIQRIC